MKWPANIPFNEQVGELTRMFCQWNECEQTVVLYALLRNIPAVQARFLSLAIEHSLHSVAELDTKEINANNPSNYSAYFLYSRTTLCDVMTFTGYITFTFTDVIIKHFILQITSTRCRQSQQRLRLINS